MEIFHRNSEPKHRITININPMNVENSKSQMRKGMLEYCILLLLKSGPAYSNDIIRSLKEANMIVVDGTLYPLLSRLKKDGLLGYNWEESTQGPPRKYYRLSPAGREWLESLDVAWEELTQTVSMLKESHRRAEADGNREAETDNNEQNNQ